MNTPILLRRGIAALAFCSLPVLSALATPVMDVRADQLLFAANELKATLALTPNQLTLWQQVSGKAEGILRNRHQRREKLHAAIKVRLADGKTELREVSTAIDAEADLSVAEDRQLRELWLSVTDALSDQQRAQVSTELLSILERMDAPDRAPRGEHDGGPSGGHGRKPGGMGGGRGGEHM